MPNKRIFRRLLSAPQYEITRYLKRRTPSFLSENFSAATENRSGSDNKKYLSVVEGALRSYSEFLNFKRHRYYQEVLENVSEAQGEDYLKIIRQQTPEFLHEQVLSKIRRNDDIGNPLTYSYTDIGRIGPQTLRYLKVASDLKKYFGADLGPEVAEIGSGYGGQCLILDELFDIKLYTLFDLPVVTQLISKYLESHILNGAYCTSTINGYQPKNIDLAISNYAFSELPRPLQDSYIRKVLLNSSKGYLTMNEETHAVNEMYTTGRSPWWNPYRLEDLRGLLPDFEVIEEIPLTGKGNYIIIWGHQ